MIRFALISVVLGLFFVMPTDIKNASIDSNGVQLPGSSSDPVISADGRVVGYTIFTRGAGVNISDVFVHDLETRATRRLSRVPGGDLADDRSDSIDLNADGSIATFVSMAGNLVPDMPERQAWQAYRLDRTTGEMRWISNVTAGPLNYRTVRNPHISDDGRFIAFSMSAGTEVYGTDENDSVFWEAHLYDHEAGVPQNISRQVSTFQHGITPDGSKVFLRETDPAQFVIYHTATGAYEPLPFPIPDEGRIWITDASADGQFIVVLTDQHLLPEDRDASDDLYVYNTAQDEYELVTPGSDFYDVFAGQISYDGRYVVFATRNRLIEPDFNDTFDVFRYDRVTATLEMVSNAGDGTSHRPDISADGRVVVFESSVTDLVPEDTNERTDIFAVTMEVGTK